jgi:hypothetical protein
MSEETPVMPVFEFVENSEYEVVTSEMGGETIKRTDADGSVWWIPKAEDNSDYQRYLRWLATQPE